VTLIYYSFSGAFSIIFSSENKIITTFAVYIVYMTFAIFTKFLLDKSDKNNLIYKICNPAFYIAVLFILIYVPIGIYLNLTPIPMFFVFLLLFLIFFMSSFNLDKQNFNLS
jgi:hypothetical protein